MRRFIYIFLLLCMPLVGFAQKVTIRAVNQPAATVFRSIIEQTGKNFVYSSELLKDMRISVDAHNCPLEKVLSDIFKDTGIDYRIKGNNVVLKHRKSDKKSKNKLPKPVSSPIVVRQEFDTTLVLKEVIVTSRLESPQVETPEIGAKKITADEVRNTPVLFGENDVIKTLQMQPGVNEGIEGLAGMYVHGGNNDENLYMLDNVPLYQVNHFAGLFSAFNTDIIRYIDFFKSSFPAKYDGRLSSFMDVRLKNGSTDGHHGSARLGLTSGAFNLSGPIGGKTTYLFGLRRSWYDVLTIPVFAVVNSTNKEENMDFRYYFMDLNAKVSHRFSDKANAFISVYFGNDLFKTKDKWYNNDTWTDETKNKFHWGNLVVQAGLNYRLSHNLTSEFTAAYTRFFSGMEHRESYNDSFGDKPSVTHSHNRSDNNINDWIFRGDFDWRPGEDNRVRFGTNYTRHSFLPSRNMREYSFNDMKTVTRDSTWAYHADEFNAYIEDDWTINDYFRVNAGLHGSMFCITGKTNYGLSPRLSVNYRPAENIALKGAYSRTTQYVHQLTQTYLALPTDQWIPITGKFKPQTADKVSLGGYWQTSDGAYTFSAEGYYKYMCNLIDYRDEYYLQPPLEMWNAQLTTGHGTSKGIDFNIEKVSGKVTGHISYSLAWADRTFKHKNGGKTFPARFDNRHTVNVMLNWKINDKVSLNAAWTGHSGNRFTLLPQVWEGTGWGMQSSSDDVPLKSSINNYQLPFYHRLDLSCVINNRRGFWTISLYNAYCHMNTIAVRRGHRDITEITPDGIKYTSKPVFQKVKLLPIIPSISYTWTF